MRKMAVILAVAIALCINLQAQNNLPVISASYTNQTLKSILSDLKTRYNLPFSYNTEIESNTKKISLDANNVSLDNFLNELCNKANLKYEIIGSNIVLKKNDAVKKTPTQTIRGQVLDGTTQQPMEGAIIRLIDSTMKIGAVADSGGYFKIENIPVGRRSIGITSIGYAENIFPDLLIESSKEMVLNVQMKESATTMGEVAVYATNRGKPMNDLAVVSATSISVEETKRFVAAAFDPARVAQNFAGVASAGDLNNELVIRGNSPKGVLYRMEGIEILSPNHFSALGSSGGAISMLSSSTMGTSDFFTGAYPAEYGNSLSGVMDLRLRTGNSEKREHSFMLGVLGIEAATEGYFTKKSRASYLVNYRYSTLALMGKFLKTIGSFAPDYQDISFKINVPTKKAGNFAIWGITGLNQSKSDAKKDTVDWKTNFDRSTYRNATWRSNTGITHKFILNPKSYLQSAAAFSLESLKETDYLSLRDSLRSKVQVGDILIQNYYVRFSSMYNLKPLAKSNFRTGVVLSTIGYNYSFKQSLSDTTPMQQRYKSFGWSLMLQAYAQWQQQFGDKVTLNGGLHFTHLFLNNTYAIDPRMSVQYRAHKDHILALAVGLHSRPEDLSTLLYEQQTDVGTTTPNRSLQIPKAVHTVLGYTFNFKNDFQLKSELYFQYLYDVGIGRDSGSALSLINASNFLYAFNNNAAFESKGTGMNYGIDITLQKFFSKGYYFLVTGSVFNSTYKTTNKQTYSSTFNRNYTANVLGGKDFRVGKRKASSIGINTKFLVMGGNRYTPVDFDASRQVGYSVELIDKTNTLRTPLYYRWDFGVSFKFNTKRATHTLMLDIQNLTNHQNIQQQYYDAATNSIQYLYQQGIFPLFNYRVEFSTR